MNVVNFIKMHGLGNDFVVLDARARPLGLGGEGARAIADRRTGVGCDQVLVLEAPEDSLADAHMRIYNADGGESAACGNGARCVAAMLMEEKGNSHVIIETVAGLLDCEAAGDGMISVDMGPAALDWRDIPLAEAMDTLHLGIGHGGLKDPVAVNLGNPHAVFFVEDAAAVNLETSGPVLERHALFPECTNVEAAQVRGSSDIRLRVWERGVGITRACGSGACATLVAAHRRGLTGRAADVELDGGRLHIEWLADNHVLMTGPVARTFSGTLDAALLG
jgi:diaminopimelate epimerase